MMDRRTALKNLSLSFGYVVSVPTIISMLGSCTKQVDTWKPIFFSDEEKHVVTHLVDIIFPKSEIPGALDVNIPQFIDMMYKEIETDIKKEQFQKGAKLFAEKFKKMFGENIENSEKDNIRKLFSVYFDLSPDKIEAVLKEQKLTADKINNEKTENYLIYKFLISVRYYTIFGYFSSEKIGEEILSYDPVPGVFQGCVPLEEIGNVWSL